MVNSEAIIKKYDKIFWQYPAITEEAFYNQNKSNTNYFGFPWATVHDQKINLNIIFNILIPFVEPQKKYYTCCQHIIFRKFINLWKALNIEVVYASHKMVKEDVINGIIIKPCPLFAVNIENKLFNSSFNNIDLLNNERKILYNFVGGYHQADYLTQIRPNIFKMKHPDNCIVKFTGNWHLHNVVFNEKQNHKLELNITSDFKSKTEYFNYFHILVPGTSEYPPPESLSKNAYAIDRSVPVLTSVLTLISIDAVILSFTVITSDAKLNIEGAVLILSVSKFNVIVEVVNVCPPVVSYTSIVLKDPVAPPPPPPPAGPCVPCVP